MLEYFLYLPKQQYKVYSVILSLSCMTSCLACCQPGWAVLVSDWLEESVLASHWSRVRVGPAAAVRPGQSPETERQRHRVTNCQGTCDIKWDLEARATTWLRTRGWFWTREGQPATLQQTRAPVGGPDLPRYTSNPEPESQHSSKSRSSSCPHPLMLLRPVSVWWRKSRDRVNLFFATQPMPV